MFWKACRVWIARSCIWTMPVGISRATCSSSRIEGKAEKGGLVFWFQESLEVLGGKSGGLTTCMKLQRFLAHYYLIPCMIIYGRD